MNPISRVGLMAALLAASAPTAVAPQEDTRPYEPPKDGKLPTRLDIRTDSRQKCAAYDVFFDGVKQRCCVIADAGKGFILRYKNAIGSMPVRGRSGKYETEHLIGKVEIKPKAQESV